MTYQRNPFNYPENPNFGQGIYRRRIRLENHQGWVSGDIEDCNHGFQVQIYHDGKNITRVEGQARRVPFTTCPAAISPLQALVGIPLGLSAKELAQQIDARANCTHWLDVALLAIIHASRSEAVRQYDIDVPDETDTAITVSVKRNNELVLQWQVKDWVVQTPEALSGKPLFKGFSAWANSFSSSEDEKEAAFVLQKAYFVSRARMFDTNSMAGESADAHPTMYDACFTYSQPQRSKAKRTANTTYDFTDSAEQLLKFV